MDSEKLKIGDFGDEVSSLHERLALHGVEISTEERKRKFFGPSTRIAVGEFQKARGIDPTCEACEKTSALLSSSPTAATVDASSIEQRAISSDILGSVKPLPDLQIQPNITGVSEETVNVVVKTPFVVKGTIRLADGSPAVGMRVSAFDRDLRHEQILGQTKTNHQGFYQIQYSPQQFRKRGKGSAGLVVKALTDDDSQLAASPVLFNAPSVAEINLKIPSAVLQTATLFEKIGRVLEPLREGVKIENLEEDEEHQDVSFLAGETGIEKSDLARFALAHKLSRNETRPEFRLEPEFWFALLGGSFYQFTEDQSLRNQLNTVLKGLPSLNANAVRKTLTRSFNQKEIAATFRDTMAGWIETFLQYVASRTVKDADEPTFVKLALKDAKIEDAQKQVKFARLFNEHKALTPGLLSELENDRSFKKPEIDDLRTSFQLSKLTRGEFSVVKRLKDEFNVRQPEQIRKLAKKSEAEWVQWVQDKSAAGDINLPIASGAVAEQAKLPEAEVYGKMLDRQFREAFPTTAFTGGLERALQNGGTHGLRHAAALGQFLNRHETFELLNTPVDDFFKNNTQSGLEELPADKSLRLEVKAVQRVFKLAPTFEATDALLADNIHSAQKVYRMGESEFVRNYGDRPGFTPATARLAWNRAADTHAAVLTIVADLKALDSEALPMALQNRSVALSTSARALQNNSAILSTFPNWNNLFRTGDLCECEQCRSVLSPAAYYTDLLMFLKDRKAKDPTNTVKDILFARRPDLGFLELNCDNALVTLPYIDVVCEVLEAAIDATGENDLELPNFTAVPADPVAAKAAVTKAFRDAFANSVNNGKGKIALGSDFSLSQVIPSDPERWVVHTDDVTYLLKKKPTSTNFFAEILPNTKASAAELRAYPQYVNPKTYEKLQQAKYPLTLPFDLFAEEVRAGFQKTNLQRWDLMRAFRGAAAPINPSDGDIAAEYFGISADASVAFDEKRLILVAEPTDTGQQIIWGEPNVNWLTTVGNVKNFLQKTSLEYTELLALLDLKFINPRGDIAIKHLDASCDTDRKVIQKLDAGKLDRIHRFLRLWRKLKNWKMWELDLVIRHPRIGKESLDETFLVNLFYFSQLRNKLGGKTTVEQICALFGNLNTETRFTKLHEKREDALYQTLFLNRRLITPLDPAFEVANVRPLLPLAPIEQITSHHSVVLAALGIRESDLVVFKELTKALSRRRYITNDLTLTNLSFLWRHAWLFKMLKFKAEEWKLVLKIFPHEVPTFADLAAKKSFLDNKYYIKTADLRPGEIDGLLQKIFYRDVLDFACPKSAFEFLEKIDHFKSAGFAPDELNWLLAGDRSSKSAVKETDASRFLATLRQELERIKTEFAIALPADEDGLIALLTSLLQRLNRSEAEVSFFLATLRGNVLLETPVQGLPAGFTFPAAIVGAPNHIPIQYDEPNKVLRFVGLLTESQQTILLNDASLTVVTDAIGDLFQQSRAAFTNYVSIKVTSTVEVILPSDRPSIPIRYNSTTQTLSFIGVMTDAERLALIAAGNPAELIDELSLLPRLAVKFYQPIFTASLDKLPPAVDFKTQLSADLAAKISYDIEQRLLRFAGIMSQAERTALDALVLNVLPTEVAYHSAINSLATQPKSIVSPDERIWLTDADLDVTQAANDTYAKRLTNAIAKALGYLSKTLTENAIVQQSSTQLGLTEALTRHLLADYPILPSRLLAHLAGNFALDATTFNGWYWVNRVATLLKKWKVTLAELEKITALTARAQLLDFQTLPLDSAGAIASLDRFLRTSRLLKLRDSLPETEITLLEVLEKLNSGGAYTKDSFADDVQLLNEAWPRADVKALTNTLNLTYPDDYLLAESWERLRRTFYFIDNLNASADKVKTFAAVAMTDFHAKTLKELLRSKFGTETWLTLSIEIQDALRERKRDALSAYLLTQAQPNPPSGKWENTNDLYAYYLLDVEMCSCQLTSRLVQASGSVQLFVQRCFMGLEPDVVVKADGDDSDSDSDSDSAWRWWKWMRKYRVWEANRKVFLWPENWIEPELKKDRSPFFKDLENELLQNEINQDTVEKAFINYLEKLDGVAQLEIAGFYQEDDGDKAIVHVFGRTHGAEPHLYYYRRYDYRQWTPWEKVELDIQGDYLIPAVVNNRLFLFWPVFTEVPNEAENSEVTIPSPGEPFTPKKAQKKLRLQMAVSDYRQGKWTPKRVSKDFDESGVYEVEIVKKHYIFFAVDHSDVDGRFGIKYAGRSVSSKQPPEAGAELSGSFEISGCKGIPEKTNLSGGFYHVVRPELVSNEVSRNEYTEFLKWVELNPRSDDDFTLVPFSPDVLAQVDPSPGLRDLVRSSPGLRAILKSSPGLWGILNSSSDLPITQLQTAVLLQTPWLFKMTPAWHLSYFDRLWLNWLLALDFIRDTKGLETYATAGTWLPFFYNDKKRTFFVLPTPTTNGARSYYPEIKKVVRQDEDAFKNQIQIRLKRIDLSNLRQAERQQLEDFFYQQFSEDTPPPSAITTPPSYTDDQVKELAKRWFMRLAHSSVGRKELLNFQSCQFHFKNFYHPFVCDFAKLVYNPLKGIPALMSRETQLKNSGFSFEQVYQPQAAVVKLPPQYPLLEDCYPKEVVDFTPDGAYSPYNWELFFHAPLLIANSLSKNQRFEEARDWYHFIFNPIGVEGTQPSGSPMSKYWITKPFFETTQDNYTEQRIDNILRMLAGDTSVSRTELENQVEEWRTNPFEPHRTANYRTVAYQKTVVMKYLDNLIAWGDNLFRQDGMENTNEATQLYILAAEILGPRPKKVPPQAKPPIETFNELEDKLDPPGDEINAFSNPLVEVENLIPPLLGNGGNGGNAAPLPMLYFCIPQNDKMLSYWDTVADRLYKLRHCMNIGGVVRQLALFEPPIDPGALVKAVAGGVDIGSALADLNAPLPLYRFNVLLQKANEVCNDVKALGSALLSVLEKKDAEAMGLLRQSQETRLLEAVKAVREQQIEEAKENVGGLHCSRTTIRERRNYYRDIEYVNAWEIASMSVHGLGILSEVTATILNATAGTSHWVPEVTVGVSGVASPVATVIFGGKNVADSASSWAAFFNGLGGILHSGANLMATQAGNERRWEDWKLQERLADKELLQMDKQIAAAELRVAITEKELENHVLQIENAKETDEFMRSKYTNQELYQWQIGQISGVYFQSYKLAYDLAKRAERCFRFELGLQESSYIQFGYWDSLKKGLLSGEKLQYDLRRLETAYLEQNRREFELTKHISLTLLDPLALVKLRETGRCFINLPEEIFDLDYPGHYFRRIKSVSLTLPCVVGPYTTISCTLRLLKNSIRINTTNGDNGYAHNTDGDGLPADDTRFIENNIPVKAIAASNAQNDSGVFELSFRDERYLPFEGAGAISQWSLELFNDNSSDFGKSLRQFDYGTITDAILHIKYTAREDTGVFKNGAIAHLRDYFSQDGTTPSLRMFNLRQEFPTQWHRFLNSTNPADGNVFELEMIPSLFPVRDAEKTLKVNRIWLLARCTDAGSYKVVMTPPLPTPPTAESNTMTLVPVNQYGGLHFSQKDVEIEVVRTDPPVKWQLKMTRPGGGGLQEDPLKKVMEVEDVLLVLGYEWE